MVISVNHAFVSAKADGTDASLVRPSNWNAAHAITLDSGNLMGRQSAGNGAVEEIACSAAAASLLSQADIASICAYLGLTPQSTGDAKLTLRSTANTGWVMMDDGNIGNAGSGASTRANADTQSLFNLLYPFADADCALLTSTGSATTRSAQGSAATAYAAGCRMSLPKQLGRTFIIGGAGAGLTARTVGHSLGSETLTLQRSDLPNVQPTFTGTSGTVTVNSQFANVVLSNGGGQTLGGGVGVSPTTLTSTGTFTPQGTVQSLNGGVTQTNPSVMMPSTAWNVMLKL